MVPSRVVPSHSTATTPVPWPQAQGLEKNLKKKNPGHAARPVRAGRAPIALPLPAGAVLLIYRAQEYCLYQLSSTHPLPSLRPQAFPVALLHGIYPGRIPAVFSTCRAPVTGPFYCLGQPSARNCAPVAQSPQVGPPGNLSIGGYLKRAGRRGVGRAPGGARGQVSRRGNR